MGKSSMQPGGSIVGINTKGVQSNTVYNNSQFLLNDVTSVHSTRLSCFSLIFHTSAGNLPLVKLREHFIQIKQRILERQFNP